MTPFFDRFKSAAQAVREMAVSAKEAVVHPLDHLLLNEAKQVEAHLPKDERTLKAKWIGSMPSPFITAFNALEYWKSLNIKHPLAQFGLAGVIAVSAMHHAHVFEKADPNAPSLSAEKSVATSAEPQLQQELQTQERTASVRWSLLPGWSPALDPRMPAARIFMEHFVQNPTSTPIQRIEQQFLADSRLSARSLKEREQAWRWAFAEHQSLALRPDGLIKPSLASKNRAFLAERSWQYAMADGLPSVNAEGLSLLERYHDRLYGADEAQRLRRQVQSLGDRPWQLARKAKTDAWVDRSLQAWVASVPMEAWSTFALGHPAHLEVQNQAFAYAAWQQQEKSPHATALKDAYIQSFGADKWNQLAMHQRRFVDAYEVVNTGSHHVEEQRRAEQFLKFYSPTPDAIVAVQLKNGRDAWVDAAWASQSHLPLIGGELPSPQFFIPETPMWETLVASAHTGVDAVSTESAPSFSPARRGSLSR